MTIVLPELPAAWAWTTVEEIGSSRDQAVLTGPFGTSMGSGDFVPDGGGAIPVLTIGCLRDTGLDLRKAVFVRPEKAAELHRYRLRRGDILFSRMATVGRAGFVEGRHDGSLFNYHIMRLRLRDDAIDPALFIYFVRGSDVVRDYVRDVNHGMTRDGINTEQLLTMPVPLPPRSAQASIVAEIESHGSRLDAAVASLERAQAKLNAYRASVLKAAVEGRLVPTEAELARKEKRDYEPADVLLRRILAERRRRWEQAELAKLIAAGKPPKDDKWKAKYEEPTPPDTTALPALPTGWVWARAEQVSEFITKGTTPDTAKMNAGDGEVPFIKVYNLTFEGTLDCSVAPTFISKETNDNELARSTCLPGDVLMNIVGPPLGKVSIVPATLPRWNINQAIARYRPLDGLIARFLAYVLLGPDAVAWAMRRAKTTAGQVNLTLEIARDLPIALPPYAEQVRVTAALDQQLSTHARECETVTKGVLRVARLRQSILKWAFEGKLVDQDPNDEPAEKLLARIRAERAAAPSTRKPRGSKENGVVRSGRGST